MHAQPRDKVIEAELVGFIKADHKHVGLLSAGREACTIDSEKGIRRGESRPLVAVEEGMILSQALPERGSLLNQVRSLTPRVPP